MRPFSLQVSVYLGQLILDYKKLNDPDLEVSLEVNTVWHVFCSQTGCILRRKLLEDVSDFCVQMI